MIDVIFTIDYEIYGNGTGNLNELVFEPTRNLQSIFKKYNCKFVAFIEAVELSKISEYRTDDYIGFVEEQVRELYGVGHEIGLHIHPQWSRAEFKDGYWSLHYDEYNLCRLQETRISTIIKESIEYLRSVLDNDYFNPLSFRAGNWLFQPTDIISKILSRNGVIIDSSVYKGGTQHKHRLDYRKAVKNSYWWSFENDVVIPADDGIMMELPIYTRMVPFWKMVSAKRFNFQKKSQAYRKTKLTDRLDRLIDTIKIFYPLKLDFCRMTIDELIQMINIVIADDKKSPYIYKPIVAIGHTKDLEDFNTIMTFLDYIQNNNIDVSTLKEAYNKCKKEIRDGASLK